MEPRHAHLFGVLGLALGTAALGNVWREAARLWRLGAWVNRVSDPLCGGLAVAVLGGWVVGVVWEAHAGRAPFSRPNLLALPLWAGLAVGAMAVTALSVTAAIVSPELSRIIWYAGATTQVGVLAGATVMAITGLTQRWNSDRPLVTLADFSPLVYPVTVGVGITTPSVKGAIECCVFDPAAEALAAALGWIAFGFTLLLLIPVISLLVRQLCSKHDVAHAVPAAVVQMAPLGVCFGAYVSAQLPYSTDRTSWLTLFLVGCNFASTVLVALFLPQLCRMSFAPTWSALTFPLVSSANGVLTYRKFAGHPLLTQQALDVLGAVYLALASVVVVLVWTRLVASSILGLGKERPSARLAALEAGKRGSSADYGAVAASGVSVNMPPRR